MIIAFVLFVILLLVILFKPVESIIFVIHMVMCFACAVIAFMAYAVASNWLYSVNPMLPTLIGAIMFGLLIYGTYFHEPKSQKDSSLRGDKEIS